MCCVRESVRVVCEEDEDEKLQKQRMEMRVMMER